jgi:outer membrane protein assembly factor BamA
MNIKIYRLYILSFLAAAFLFSIDVHGQAADSTKKEKDPSKFDSFNSKMERLFVWMPVPVYSRSSEAGDIFGLAKYNLFRLSKKDTVSGPSKVSGVGTVSTKGRVNVSLGGELVFNQNKNIALAYFNYKKVPEYIFGIGNDVKKEDVEQVTTNRIKVEGNFTWLFSKKLYIGPQFDFANYFEVSTDSNSFLIRDNVPGLNGGNNMGLGLAMLWENRSNRYNSATGGYVEFTTVFYTKVLGSDYNYTRMDLDMRKYFTPWPKLKHVLAFQATTSYSSDGAPFYDLALMGGEVKMRGYYQGAYRDHVLVDAQTEYRLPVWKIIGVVGFFGIGRVAPDYGHLALDGFHYSYGAGLRLKVDSKNNINVRFDFGFGPDGINGSYINFTEAF